MVAALLGKKIGMTRVYREDGKIVPVTVIQAGPCSVLQVKKGGETVDGYNAVQLGFEDVKAHRSTLPMIGHAAVAGTGPKRFIREVRTQEVQAAAPGDVWTVEMFEAAGTRYVDVVATTKGRGFAGVISGMVSGVSRPLTVQSVNTVRLEASGPTPPADWAGRSRRASGCPATWVMSAGPRGTRNWSGWTRPTTSCWSRAVFPVPTGATWWCGRPRRGDSSGCEQGTRAAKVRRNRR